MGVLYMLGILKVWFLFVAVLFMLFWIVCGGYVGNLDKGSHHCPQLPVNVRYLALLPVGCRIGCRCAKAALVPGRSACGVTRGRSGGKWLDTGPMLRRELTRFAKELVWGQGREESQA